MASFFQYTTPPEANITCHQDFLSNILGRISIKKKIKCKLFLTELKGKVILIYCFFNLSANLSVVSQDWNIWLQYFAYLFKRGRPCQWCENSTCLC